MIKLTHILSEITNELYSNPICPRKAGESDEEYKQRCAPLMGTSVLMNIPSVSEEKEEDVEEALTPMQKLARKRALAGKRRLIQRKRQRTAIRKKGYDKLYKKAYKAAYRDVYEFFRNRLFPDTPKEELSIIQKQRIEYWVEKKKRKVMKRARWKYLPKFREEEAEKFAGKSNIFTESTFIFSYGSGNGKFLHQLNSFRLKDAFSNFVKMYNIPKSEWKNVLVKKSNKFFGNSKWEKYQPND